MPSSEETTGAERTASWSERYYALPCFYVWPDHDEDRGEFVHAETAGKAKAVRWRAFNEVYPDFQFTRMRARLVRAARRPVAEGGERHEG